MNDVSAQVDVATTAMALRNEKVKGRQAVKLIEGAGGGGQQLASPAPPSTPVAVTPRAGSTVEVVA